MEIIQQYYEYCQQLLKDTAQDEASSMQQAARLMSDACLQGGRIYVFGSGHSHIMAEEVYARAGGLALIKPILPTELMVIDFPRKSTGIERLSGYSAALLEHYNLDAKDVIVIISNSGRNAVPVEMAEAARKKGAKIIALTSLDHSKKTDSRAPSGKKLYELADVVIDNHAPKGDAAFYIDGCKTPAGPVSDFLGIFIMEALVVQVSQNLMEAGMEPPLFTSSNLDEGDARNEELFSTYYGYWK